MENTYHLSQVPGYIPRILKAFPMTAEILLISLLSSLLIGALVAAGALNRHKVINKVSNGFIAFMRGIPTLVLIFLLYLGFPQIMAAIGIDMSGVSKPVYIITSLSLGASANMAEMMRTAYLAVEKGQREAAYSVGMRSSTAFFRIMLPQAFGIAIPTLGNNIILLFKETSLAFTVGVIDILGKARAISAASYGSNQLEVYLAAGIIFWVICAGLEQLSKWAEKLYTKGRRQTAG